MRNVLTSRVTNISRGPRGASARVLSSSSPSPALSGSMANLTVYANQPATKGKVVLHTTIGPFDVELWSKEAPLACRNFVQLCMEGYYDGCIFHRVIKDFMAQTGDPTGTGTGGESVYEEGGPEGAGAQGIFKDEFNGRLRFIHRGLLGMASNGPHTNGSQFFVTLSNCEWLDKKHTIFGKITGRPSPWPSP